ncbi:MAG TPA: hydantoinase/oxoprolinase family protein [Actinomycetota bacterium]|nr:hydantoinase/oxoprolinase family protein [Actinomycetota bacterium]
MQSGIEDPIEPGAAGGSRVGIDIGGTFTDLAAVDGAGRLHLAKVDTTPAAPEGGAIAVLEASDVAPHALDVLVHGTTIVINAITERSGAPTALLTTAGFRDVLEIGRANRPDLYNLAYRKPPPFVSRRLRFEVAERLDHVGRELVPLDEPALIPIAAALREAGIESLAICFLHAWVEASHEHRAAEVLAPMLPGVEIVCSGDVSGEWREFERTSTTVLSAYVKPAVGRYLHGFRSALDGAGVGAPLLVMRSSGGVASVDRAAANPIALLESGPVAGVEAAAELGRRLGFTDVLTLDIGGTTAKTSAVRQGRPQIETLYHVERTPVSAGYPIQVPVVQIVEIGAGGGSIAWCDDAGGLHLGPRSAGADPGPACYGRGGREPTLTDANLLAGRLDPDRFLGGAKVLDVGAAEEAMGRLGAILGSDAGRTTRGILRYAVAQMAHALRLVTVRRGRDPRDFTLIAYGGAGPLHASLLARELGIGRIVIPPAPGHFSAVGMLSGKLAADAIRTRIGPLVPELLAPLLNELEDEASAALGVGGPFEIRRFVQLRYEGQEHTLEVAVPDGLIDPAAIEAILRGFAATSEESYAFSLDQPVQLVAARVAASAPGASVGWALSDDALPGVVDERAVDLDEHGGRRSVPIRTRGSIPADAPISGPCVIEEAASTTLVLPGQSVRRDAIGNLVIEERP